jgi:hypothetical protein
MDLLYQIQRRFFAERSGKVEALRSLVEFCAQSMFRWICSAQTRALDTPRLLPNLLKLRLRPISKIQTGLLRGSLWAIQR